VDTIEDKKGENIVLLDLRPDAVIADFFVVATGTSDRQLKALINNVDEAVTERFGINPYAREGEAESGWVLIDYGNVIVHLFTESQRRYYDLEGFWKQAHILVSIQ
jgi:ribosome-associated protein